MKKIVTYTLLVIIAWFSLYFTGLTSQFIQLFKDENGHTIWQYVANWSSGVLIILLSVTAIILTFSRAAKQKANIELNAIKDDLEIRVQERTQQLRTSEHYIASILESMPSMLVGLNPQGVITQWNNRAEQYTGISAKDALGKDLWEAYPIITITRDQVNDAIKSKDTTTIRQNQRGLFHFDITIYPLPGENESDIVLLLDDVSKQVKSENKLIQRDKISSMGELASSMAHDISVPLQRIIANINELRPQIARTSEENQETKLQSANQLIDDALSQGEQANAIVENLLDFAGTKQNDKQPALMTEIMDHSLVLADKILSSPEGMSFSDITVEREYDEKIPLVNCHVSEIQQVFLSLLRHSFHALDSNQEKGFKPTIKIRILESYSALWLKISHNGLGLTSEEQQSIFEPFFSNQLIENQYEANKRLSFSHFVITEHHSGQMAVTSDVKVGTTFHMQFS